MVSNTASWILSYLIPSAGLSCILQATIACTDASSSRFMVSRSRFSVALVEAEASSAWCLSSSGRHWVFPARAPSASETSGPNFMDMVTTDGERPGRGQSGNPSKLSKVAHTAPIVITMMLGLPISLGNTEFRATCPSSMGDSNQNASWDDMALLKLKPNLVASLWVFDPTLHCTFTTATNYYYYYYYSYSYSYYYYYYYYYYYHRYLQMFLSTFVLPNNSDNNYNPHDSGPKPKPTMPLLWHHCRISRNQMFLGSMHSAQSGTESHPGQPGMVFLDTGTVQA